MSDQQKGWPGEAFILSNATIESTLPVLRRYLFLVAGMRSSVVLAWETLFAFLFIGAINLLRGRPTDLFKKENLGNLVVAAAIFGVFFPLLTFVGLEYTTAGNVAVILTFEAFTSFLLFNVFLRKPIIRAHLFGALLMMIGALIVLSPNLEAFHAGDFIIVLAVMLPPFGNLFTERLKGKVSPEQILLFRTSVATPFFFILAILSGESLVVPGPRIWLILVITGALCLGAGKILWIEGINRIGTLKAASLANVKPVLTLPFAFWILGERPLYTQLLALPFAILGVYLLKRPVVVKPA